MDWKTKWDEMAKAKNELVANRYVVNNKPIKMESYKKMLLSIKEKLELNKRVNLLEVGCGTGLSTKFLSKYVKKSYGTDFIEDMVKKARNKGIYALKCEAAQQPFVDNFFDRILCFSVFHYFPNYNYALKVLKEFKRLTKKDGVILVGDVPDLKKKGSYEKVYGKNNHHLWYEKAFFKNFGKVKFFDKKNVFRFDVVIKKWV